MGTKRVGWARIQSLINENANDLKMRKHAVTTALSADTTITADHYGTVILIDASGAGNITLTLPDSPAIGDSLEFLLTVNSNAAAEVLR